MAKRGPIVGGIILIIIAGLVEVYSLDLDNTIPLMNNLCNSGSELFQFTCILAQDINRLENFMTRTIFGLGIFGVILIIVGAISPKLKRKKYLCHQCDFRTNKRREIESHCTIFHKNGDYYTR